MKDEKVKVPTVKVTLEIPKAIHSLMMKLAAVEGSDVSEWYTEALVRDVGAMLGNAHDVFDVPRLVKFNGLQTLVGEDP